MKMDVQSSWFLKICSYMSFLLRITSMFRVQSLCDLIRWRSAVIPTGALSAWAAIRRGKRGVGTLPSLAGGCWGPDHQHVKRQKETRRWALAGLGGCWDVGCWGGVGGHGMFEGEWGGDILETHNLGYFHQVGPDKLMVEGSGSPNSTDLFLWYLFFNLQIQNTKQANVLTSGWLLFLQTATFICLLNLIV